MLNEVRLIGNLGRDPEIRTTQSGDTIATLSIATSESWRDRESGQRVSRTEWHRVVAFRKLAEICRDYLRKGSRVYVCGEMRTRKWQDKTGQDRYTTEVVLSGYSAQMLMLDRRADNPDGAVVQPTAQPTAQPQQSTDEYLDDDIPF